MKGKFLFIAGLAIGYVFGTRAGRRRYEQIKTAAQNIWESEPVQWSVKQAQDAVGDVAEEALTVAKRVIHQVTGEKPAAKKPAAKKPAAKAATEPAAKMAAPKTAPKPAAK
ncbi:MAG: hypothetical protein RLY59_1282 [Actinomycetota bacterium]|jgi:hypothetical protein